MKIVLQFGPDAKFLKEELEAQMERAIADVAAGSRPEYAAGFYAASVMIAESIESRYLAIRRGPREIVEDEANAQ